MRSFGHRDHAGVRVGGDDEERLAPGVVGPVVGGRGKGDAHAGDVRLRDVALAVVDADMAVDVEEPERGAEGRDAPLGEEVAEERRPPLRARRESLRQRLDLWGAVEPDDAAEVHR